MGWASWTTNSVAAGPGGVETQEAGALTGTVDVHTSWTDGRARVTVRRTGEAQWFTVAGSPATCPSGYQSRLLHDRVVGAVRAGGGAGVLGRPPDRRAWYEAPGPRPSAA
ncbi:MULTISPECIES: hypothetical protein [unclassified Streptomyces]|uniref:hypothetical protein n=1 Tax=unclassified Streptomyces TaxID=2593676 RepID=UPI002E31F8E0|nr:MULTISPECIES: hypothetical protein [unclassified Streptomyces]WUC63281.1 hypothetical protein OG861_03095 [Streptomyces sp. NBC_00539]